MRQNSKKRNKNVWYKKFPFPRLYLSAEPPERKPRAQLTEKAPKPPSFCRKKVPSFVLGRGWSPAPASFKRLPRKRGEKVNFFFENLSLLPETRAPKEHFKLVFGSGNSDLAKIRPLKIWPPAINWKSSLYENFHPFKPTNASPTLRDMTLLVKIPRCY